MASVHVTVDGQERQCSFDRLVLGGYTGRDQAAVQAHINELAAHGIPAPTRVPMLFACAPELLTTGDQVSVLSEDTSGEAEFVLFTDGPEILVGAGSDHTDRKLEETDIPRAKQLCAKVVSRELWRLTDVADHWDELVLRAWVGREGPETLYQEGPVGQMLPPDAILDYVREHVRGPLGPAAVFSGTFAVIGGHFRPAPTFTVELEDPRRGRSLRCAYRVRTLDYLE